MSKIISVLSKIPNLSKELQLLMPNLIFRDILLDECYEQLYQSEIIIADINILIPYKSKLTSKWVQATWAGIGDDLHENLIDLPFMLTRFSGDYFGKMMSEYIITAIVNNERNFYQIKDNQNNKLWNTDECIQNYRVISDLSIGILGLGTIGSFVARSLHLLGARILGLSNSSEVRQDMKGTVHKYYTAKDLPYFLSECDYIINVLPSTKKTTGLLNGNILKNCEEKKAVFINVGRGSIIDENDLIQALNANWISSAILDVFKTEPLPKENLLWKMPQVTITPHVAAISRPKDIAKQFLQNYILYNSGKTLPFVFDVKKGY